MLKRLFVVLVISLAIALQTAHAQRAVIVVRHAEKQDNSADSALSSIGEARAERLAKYLKDAGVTAIYVTQLVRTAQTAEPLAKALGVKPIVIPLADQATLLEQVRTKHTNGVVLIVGHSGTVPRILQQLGAKEPVAIAEDDYDNLFVLIPGATPALLKFHY